MDSENNYGRIEEYDPSIFEQFDEPSFITKNDDFYNEVIDVIIECTKLECTKRECTNVSRELAIIAYKDTDDCLRAVLYLNYDRNMRNIYEYMLKYKVPKEIARKSLGIEDNHTRTCLSDNTESDFCQQK